MAAGTLYMHVYSTYFYFPLHDLIEALVFYSLRDNHPHMVVPQRNKSHAAIKHELQHVQSVCHMSATFIALRNTILYVGGENVL